MKGLHPWGLEGGEGGPVTDWQERALAWVLGELKRKMLL